MLFFSHKGTSFFSLDDFFLYGLAQELVYSFLFSQTSYKEKIGKNNEIDFVFALEPRHPVELQIFLQLAKKVDCDALLLPENRRVEDIVQDCLHALASPQKQIVLIVFSARDGGKYRLQSWFSQQKKWQNKGFFIDIPPSFRASVVRNLMEKDLLQENIFSNFSTDDVSHKAAIFSLSQEKSVENSSHFLMSSVKKNCCRLLFFSSGSSNRPKLIVFDRKMIHHAIALQNKIFPFHRGCRWALTLPIYHVGGLSIIFRSFLGGGDFCFFFNEAESKKMEIILDEICGDDEKEKANKNDRFLKSSLQKLSRKRVLSEEQKKNKEQFLFCLLGAHYEKSPSLNAIKKAKITHLSLSVYQLSRYVFHHSNEKEKAFFENNFFMAKDFAPTADDQKKFVEWMKKQSSLHFVFVGGGFIPQWVWQMCFFEKWFRCQQKKIGDKTHDSPAPAPALASDNKNSCCGGLDCRVMSLLSILRPTYGMSETFAQIATWNGLDEDGFLHLLDGRKIKNIDENLYMYRIGIFSGYMICGHVVFPGEDDQWWMCDDLVEVRQEKKSADNANAINNNKNLCQKYPEDFLFKLFILGRKSNVVITGGKNVLAEEVEQKLFQSNFFISNIVLGLPHPSWGEELVCLCMLRDENILRKCMECRDHHDHHDEKNCPESLFYRPLFEKTLFSLEGYQRPKKYFLWKNAKDSSLFSADTATVKHSTSSSNSLEKIRRRLLKDGILKGFFPLFFAVERDYSQK